MGNNATSGMELRAVTVGSFHLGADSRARPGSVTTTGSGHGFSAIPKHFPLLPVSEDHSLVVHGERVTFDYAGGHASPFPMHGKF
jgi:hypothetical protein